MLIGEITPRASLEGVWHHPVVIESGGDHLCRPVTLEGHYHIDKPFEGTIQCVEQAALTFDGTQVVMTDYRPNRQTRLEVLLRVPAGTEQRYLYGCRSLTAEETASCWLLTGSTGASAAFGTAAVATGAAMNANRNYVLTADKESICLQTWQWMLLDETENFSGDTLCIGGLHHAQTVDERMFQGTLYGVRICEGNELVRSYIPAHCGTSEGFFELLSGQFCPRQTVSVVSRFGEVPASFKTGGTQLTDYVIFGKEGGVGDYDETTGRYCIPITVRSKNLLENNFQSETYHGLTVTVNADKSVTVNGTATATTTLALHDGSHTPTTTAQEIENGTYYLSGVPEGAETGTYTMSYRYTPASGGSSQVGRIPVEGMTLDNTSGDYRYLSVYIAVWNGVTVDNVTFYPMLRNIDSTAGYEPAFHSRTELLCDAPLTAGEVLSFDDTQQAIAASPLAVNTLTVHTQVPPEAVYLAYTIPQETEGGT